MTPLAKALLVKTLGQEVGFDLLGVTRAVPLAGDAYYREWLAAGYGGTMHYLKRNVHLRAEPAGLLPGARSIICGAVNYKRMDGYLGPAAVCRRNPLGAADHAPTGAVAQYARGRDYHTVLRQMFAKLLDCLRERLPETFEARVFVDTGPLLERELAARAGLGWIGRNTCLLNGDLGSYLFLGEAVTTLDLAADDPVPDRCASCTRCLVACPTGALVAPKELDARRCIAYLTIEHRGPIPDEFRAPIGQRVFGCDTCQQVCPYNARAPLAAHPELTADIIPAHLDLARLHRLRSGEYHRLVRGSTGRRASRAMWRRNADVAAANAVGDVGDVRPSRRGDGSQNARLPIAPAGEPGS